MARLEQTARKLLEEHIKTDTVSFDVPLFIRLLEVAREELKSDESLHNLVTQILQYKDHVMTMDDYQNIMKYKK